MSQQKKSPNKDIVLTLLFLALALVWACVIFGFSSQDAEQSASLSEEVTEVIVDTFEVKTEPNIIEHFVRKTAHFTEYAVFGGLLFLSFAFFCRYKQKSPYLALIPSSLVSLVYAASDEFHQGFVSGRSPELIDVCIDTSGAVLAGALICLIIYIVRKIKMRKALK